MSGSRSAPVAIRHRRNAGRLHITRWQWRRRRRKRCLVTFQAFRLRTSASSARFRASATSSWCRTDGPDGALHDYEITHTFGIDPLQQYLIGFPDGRYQMLGLAWDTRPKDKGGQRWFHLYPDEKLAAGVAAALDRPRPELELPVRRLPYDRSEEELRSLRQHVRDHLGQSRRDLRGLPWPRIPSRGVGKDRIECGARRQVRPAR